MGDPLNQLTQRASQNQLTYQTISMSTSCLTEGSVGGAGQTAATVLWGDCTGWLLPLTSQTKHERKTQGGQDPAES